MVKIQSNWIGLAARRSIFNCVSFRIKGNATGKVNMQYYFYFACCCCKDFHKLFIARHSSDLKRTQSARQDSTCNMTMSHVHHQVNVMITNYVFRSQDMSRDHPTCLVLSSQDMFRDHKTCLAIYVLERSHSYDVTFVERDSRVRNTFALFPLGIIPTTFILLGIGTSIIELVHDICCI